MADEETIINDVDVKWYRIYKDSIFDAQLSFYDYTINEAYTNHDPDIETLMDERESFIKTYFETYSKEIHKAVYTMGADEVIRELTKFVHAHKE